MSKKSIAFGWILKAKLMCFRKSIFFMNLSKCLKLKFCNLSHFSNNLIIFQINLIAFAFANYLSNYDFQALIYILLDSIKRMYSISFSFKCLIHFISCLEVNLVVWLYCRFCHLRTTQWNFWRNRREFLKGIRMMFWIRWSSTALLLQRTGVSQAKQFSKSTSIEKHSLLFVLNNSLLMAW